MLQNLQLYLNSANLQLAGKTNENHSGQQHDDDNSSAASSEDSNPIIWEDDAGTDLRHLFFHRNNTNGEEGELLPTMTQQVDEMLNMEDSDSSDADNNNASLEHTPPAAATRSGKNKKQKILLDSGDVLATISKVKRLRRPNESNRRNNNNDNMGAARAMNKVGGEEIDNKDCMIEEDAADDVEERKLAAATQDVDRVYDLHGLSSTFHFEITIKREQHQSTAAAAAAATTIINESRCGNVG